MSTLGDTLRGERLRRGLKAEEIAAEIKISPYMVEAMETGRFDRLPGGSYRRSFLRQYAHILGVDEKAVVAEFKEEYGEPEVELPKPPFRQSKMPAGLAWAALAGAAFFGAYKVVPRMRLDLPDLVSHRTVVAPSPIQAGFTPPVEVPPPTLTAAPQPVQEVVPPIKVVLTATEPVWVSVQCDGLSSFRGIIESSAVKEFSATSKVTVLAGNAGGLGISLNGHAVNPIGARREIQLVELTAQGARVVPRRRAPAATLSRDEPGGAI